ncbi:MAG: alpha/beta fold hydrolase [Cyanobacteria bacterium J06638_22]
MGQQFSEAGVSADAWRSPLAQRDHLGNQRDWVWRGWSIRYSFLRSPRNDGLPIVFLHGFGASLLQWRGNLQPLSQHHTIYALDLLGFGASEKASTEFRVSLWVEQVRAFCQQFIGQPIVLVGHSLGALVALTAVTRYPELAQGLILVTLPATRQELLPGPVQSVVHSIENLFANSFLIKQILRFARRPSFIRSALQKIYTDTQYVNEDLVASFVEPAHHRGADRTLLKLVRARTATDFSDDTRSLLQRLDIDTLVLWGQNDNIIPIQWGRQLPEFNPYLTMVEIPDAGHCLYDEQAERVNHEILTWIQQTIDIPHPTQTPV